MPSAEETTYLIEVMPDAGVSQDSFTSRDVDVLVSRIKENLRLSGLKSRSSLAQKMRTSPYQLPSRTLADSSLYPRCRKPSYFDSEFEDSYERFQALLRKGALIKEAVKRLQACPEDPADEDEENVAEEEEVEEEVGNIQTNKTRPTNASASLDSMYSEDDTWYMDMRDVRYEGYRIANEKTETTMLDEKKNAGIFRAAPSCL